MTQSIVIEADGGSRGNPGLAAYGALVRDAATGRVIAERAEVIGVATNNVAEYSGLIAGLELAREHAPEARLEVRMDSKLVIEQMAGRWKVKHPDMVPLSQRARRLAPPDVTWTWIPRERNKAADALLNVVLDQAQGKAPRATRAPADPVPEVTADPVKNPLIGWRAEAGGDPTTIVLLRHGVTDHTLRKLFCGSGGSDPALNETGIEQASRAAAWLRALGGVDAVVSSPLLRTQQTAGIVARELGLEVALEPGIAEASFGDWDGLGFGEVMRRWPTEMDAWLSSTAVAPPGGETFDAVYERVVAARDRIIAAHPGRTVVVVSHVTPIKLMVRAALDAPMHVIHRMELAPASISTIQWWPDGTPSLRNFSVVPE